MKLKYGNILAHEINFNSPILEQIFKIIDGDNKNFIIVLKELKNVSAENFIKNLITIRKNYYKDKKTLEENEKLLYEKINNFTNIFVKK